MNEEVQQVAARYFFWRFISMVLLLNFIVWTVVAISLGGEAVSGKEEGGNYYLHSRNGYIEVSHQIYQYSKIHTYAVFVSGPFCFFAILAANQARTRLRELTGR